MVTLEAAHTANAALVASQQLVAVFPGGTSGIASYTIFQLVEHCSNNGKGLRIYIVGRNTKAAEQVIADCHKISKGVQVLFVRSEDLSLLKNVDRACEEIERLETERKGGGPPRVDMLVMSHADLHFGARRDTSEGLDKTMSLLYYSRMRFITSLMPLLLASTIGHARIISIYGAGLEKNLPRFYPDDLSLRNPSHYSLLAYRTHVPVLTTFFFEHLANKYPGKLSLTHIFPSLVITPAFDASYHPWWFKLIWMFVKPFSGWISVGHNEIGERVLFCATERFQPKGAKATKNISDIEVAYSSDGTLGGGAYSVNHKGEVNDIENTYAAMRAKAFGDVVCRHTTDAFDAVDRGEVFAS